MKRATFRTLVRDYRKVIKAEGLPAPLYGDVAQAVWKVSGLLWDYFFDDLPIINSHVQGKSRVLDFGCGYGFFSVVLAEEGFEVYGLDIERGCLPVWAGLEQKWPVRFKEYSGRHIPFEDGFFDFAVANAVLEHIRPEGGDLQLTLNELARVMRPG